MQITLCTFSLLTSFITLISHVFQYSAALQVENVITETQYSERAESIAFSGMVTG